jgi:hypothetical protein
VERRSVFRDEAHARRVFRDWTFRTENLVDSRYRTVDVPLLLRESRSKRRLWQWIAKALGLRDRHGPQR